MAKKPKMPSQKMKKSPPPGAEDAAGGDAGQGEDEAPAPKGRPGKSGKAPKVPASGRSKAVKDEEPKQPVKLDWFGLMLIILVNASIITGFFIWDAAAGKRINQTMMNRKVIQDYNLLSPKPKLVTYQSSDTIGKMPGDVDVAVLDKGYLKTIEGELTLMPVQVGDVFRVKGWAPSQESFVEFHVFEVGPTTSRAWICMGTRWDKRAQLRMNEESMKAKVAINSELERNWDYQEVRKLVEIRRLKDQK